jgi:Helicase associated domain
LRELWEYQQQFGDFSVEQDYKNGLLADWVANQRDKQGELTLDQEDALNRIGFEWEATSFKEKHWNDMFEQLRAYYEEHGDCKVPLLYKVILSRVYNLADCSSAQTCLVLEKPLAGEMGPISPRRIQPRGADQ